MGEVKTPCASPTTDIKNDLYEALDVVVCRRGRKRRSLIFFLNEASRPSHGGRFDRVITIRGHLHIWVGYGDSAERNGTNIPVPIGHAFCFQACLPNST